ncbi:MAG: hypothetical protein ABR564_08260, partial [Candidatus Dormibacteria bacterium]
ALCCTAVLISACGDAPASGFPIVHPVTPPPPVVAADADGRVYLEAVGGGADGILDSFRSTRDSCVRSMATDCAQALLSLQGLTDRFTRELSTRRVPAGLAVPDGRLREAVTNLSTALDGILNGVLSQDRNLVDHDLGNAAAAAAGIEAVRASLSRPRG